MDEAEQLNVRSIRARARKREKISNALVDSIRNIDSSELTSSSAV